MKYLSLYDLAGIQPYIFGSNVLKENLGGSFLVNQALDRWLPEAAEEAGAEFQWAGGGNGMVAASSVDQAREVARCLSIKLHEQAPGLHVACAHAEWDETPEGFRKARESLQAKLNDHKAGRWPPAAFNGAGVTTACNTTGEPAVAWENERWLGPAALARIQSSDAAQKDIQKLFELDRYVDAKGKSQRLVWTKDIDKLGRSKGEQSMIGVIHFDGNGMGKRFRKTETLDELRDLSSAVNEAGKETLRAALRWVLDHLPRIMDPDLGGFAPHKEEDRVESAHCFPVRPIVYGGDDITLVCEARIALDLAAELLRAWHEHTRRLPDGPAHACAGVALVRAHYPFYRAYHLAAELCRGAKDHLGKAEVEASVLDWEFIAGAGLTTLKERRKKHYRSATDEQLHARPYYVVDDAPATARFRSWDWFRNTLVHALQEQETTHTRFKELAGVLYRGRVHTEIYLRRLSDRFGLRRGAWDKDNPCLCLPQPASLALPNGFDGGMTPYLDAIELMDRMLPRTCYNGAPAES